MVISTIVANPESGNCPKGMIMKTFHCPKPTGISKTVPSRPELDSPPCRIYSGLYYPVIRLVCEAEVVYKNGTSELGCDGFGAGVKPVTGSAVETCNEHIYHGLDLSTFDIHREGDIKFPQDLFPGGFPTMAECLLAVNRFCDMYMAKYLEDLKEGDDSFGKLTCCVTTGMTMPPQQSTVKNPTTPGDPAPEQSSPQVPKPPVTDVKPPEKKPDLPTPKQPPTIIIHGPNKSPY